MRRTVSFFLSITLLFLIVGCGGLPKEAKERVKILHGSFKAAAETIEKLEASYRTAKQREVYVKFLRVYAERERWDDSSGKAKQVLEEAKQLFAKEVEPIISRNDEKELVALNRQLTRVESKISEAIQAAKHPMQRSSFLIKARDEADQWIKTARDEASRVDKFHSDLEEVAGFYSKNYPNKKDDIAVRFAPVKKWRLDSKTALATAEKEYKAKTPDYSLFGDGCVLISDSNKALARYYMEFRNKLSELDRSYSKTLIDMKADYYVVIGRVSWEESEAIEWPTETEHLYAPRQVDEATFEFFDKLPDDEDVARYRAGFFSGANFKPLIDEHKFAALRLDTRENWPNGDNEADFYIADLPIKFYHKYLIVENGIKKETDWELVSESYFDANEDNLGMDLVSKPYGFFEEEKVLTATPASMAYVGNPRYGHWQRDGSGQSFWEFYGQYRLISDLFGSPRYYHDDWDNWSTNYRGRRPYYGPEDDDDDRYGSGAGTTRTRYSGSHYSKSGGFKDSESSVRNGAGRRGGGPGGSGK